MTNQKISPLLGIIININIVVGGAFFLSSQTVTEISGVYAPLVWFFVGLSLLPLISVLSTLSSHYPVSGGLYTYTTELLSPYLGFMSGFGYFLGTAAGNALVLYSFRVGLQQLFFPSLPGTSGIALDLIVIALFAFLNSRNVDFLQPLQTIFTILKFIPFIAVVVGAFYLFNGSYFVHPPTPSWSLLMKGIPTVLFAYIGIEACCSIGHLIQDGTKNVTRVLFISLAIITALYSIMQFLIIGIHGTSYTDAFTTILPQITTNPSLIWWGNLLIQCAIVSSYLGGSYSMFYTNNWNLYAMAKDNTLPFSTQLTYLNRYQSPTLCIIIQSLLIMVFLMLTKNIDLLMTMSDFGVIITYLLSTFAYTALVKKQNKKHYGVAIAATAFCFYLLSISFGKLLSDGIVIAIPYFGMIALGTILYLSKKYSAS